MAKKPVVTVTNVNEIEKTWKVAHASHRLYKFLKAQSIEPINSMKFGKGMMHLYPRDILTNMELKQAYLKYIDKPVKKVLKATMPSNGVDYSAVLDSITTALMRLEGKVDELKTLWTTPAIPHVGAFDDEQPAGH